MRGLPPPPSNVVRLDLDFLVNGRDFHTGLWLLIPDVETAGVAYLDALVADFISFVVGGVTGVMHSGSSWVTCRASYGGTTPASFIGYVTPNHGAWSGGQADAIATGLYLVSSTGGRGSGSRLRFPAVPDDFVDDNWRLASTAVAQLVILANDITNFVSGTIGPTGAPAIVGTVQRAARGAPLPVASFDPAQAIVPSYRVDFLGRRMPKTRHVSPQ